VTKSFVGTLATMLAAEGVIDPAAPVTRYLPAMKNTAYGDATVRQVMDMTIGVKFSEDYSDPNVEVFAYAHHGPDAGATHVGADLVEAWGGTRCLLHRGRHRHRIGRRRPRTDRGSRQR
jgi:CubicO group peptidase (beta-lactamase class C family)